MLNILEESEIPRLTDKKMIDFANKVLREEKNLYKEARADLEKVIWPECDKAFMCIRKLPRGQFMKWVDNGTLGESDVRDNIKAIIDQILLGMMPPDEKWLTCVSPLEENQDILDKVQDYQSYLHHTAQTRNAYGRHLTQVAVRGTGFIGVRWDKTFAVETLPKRAIAKMKKLAEASGQPFDPRSARKWREVYNGPCVEPIDAYRILLDPTHEMSPDRRIPSIMIMYKSPEDLKDAWDEETGEKFYDQDALKDITPFPTRELYDRDPYQFETSKIMGLTPSFELDQSELVPVYIFHRIVRRHEDLKFVDRFIYVAESHANDGWRVIKIQENPSPFGDPPFFLDTWDDWINHPYGIGAVEKSLPAYNAKNVMAALTLNASLAQVFPPMMFLTGMLPDDRKPTLAPGSWTPITNKANIGLEVAKPIPIGDMSNLVSGQQTQQFLGAKIISQMGATGASLFTDPTKTPSQEKTATQVRQETSNMVVGRENQVEKFTLSSLQPLAQCVLNYSRRAHSGWIKFVKRLPNGDAKPGVLSAKALDQDWTIMIAGRRGVANKAHEMANLMQILEIMSRNPQIATLMRNYPLIFQEVLFKLLSRLGMTLTDEMKMSSQEIAANDPQVQAEALMKAIESPEGQALLSQVAEGMVTGGQNVTGQA